MGFITRQHQFTVFMKWDALWCTWSHGWLRSSAYRTRKKIIIKWGTKLDSICRFSIDIAIRCVICASGAIATFDKWFHVHIHSIDSHMPGKRKIAHIFIGIYYCILTQEIFKCNRRVWAPVVQSALIGYWTKRMPDSNCMCGNLKIYRNFCALYNEMFWITSKRSIMLFLERN